jgi:hypothetical protein
MGCHGCIVRKPAHLGNLRRLFRLFAAKGEAMEHAKRVWNSQEWRLVMLAAWPALVKIKDGHGAGPKRAQAIGAAQKRALPPDRHYAEKALANATRFAKDSGNAYGKAHAEIEAMPDSEREALRDQWHRKPRAIPATAEAAAADGRPSRMYWKPQEWALIARRVHYWQTSLNDKRPLSRLLCDAAAIELVPSRHKRIVSLTGSRIKPFLLEKLAAGIKAADLITDRPFNPDATAAAPAYLATTPPPAPLDAPQAPISALAGPAAAAQPRPIFLADVSPAAAAFGSALASSFDQYMAADRAAQVQAIAATVQLKMENLAALVASQVAAQITQGMQETVRQILAAELGGLDQHQANTATVARLADAVNPAPQRPRFKVDVVGGFEGQDVTSRILKKYGQDFDLRFTHPDASRYKARPGASIMVLHNRTPHSLTNAATAAAKRAGVKPLLISATEAHISGALDSLRANGHH